MKIIEARALLTADDQASQKIVAMAKQISEVTKAQQAYVKAGGSQFAQLAKQIDATNAKIAQTRVYQNQAKQLGDMSAAHQRARETVRGLAAQLMAADAPSKKLQQSYQRATDSADKMGRALETQRARLRGSASELDKMGVSVKNLASAERDLAAQSAAAHRELAQRMLTSQKWAKRREVATSMASAAAVGGAAMVAHGARTAVHEGAAQQHATQTLARAGLSQAEQAVVVEQARQDAGKYGLNYAGLIGENRQAFAVASNPKDAADIMHTNARLMAAIRSMNPKMGEEGLSREATFAIKAGEVAGVAKSSKSYEDFINDAVRWKMVEGSQLTMEQVHGLMKQGGMSVMHLSPEFRRGILGQMVAEQGGERVGTFIGGMAKAAAGVGGSNTKTSLNAALDMGLVRKDQVQFGKNGPVRFKKGQKWNDAELLASDPIEWLYRHSKDIDRLAGNVTSKEFDTAKSSDEHHGTDEQIRRQIALNKLFPNSQVARNMVELDEKKDQYRQKAPRFSMADDLAAAEKSVTDVAVAADKLSTSMHNLLGALTAPGMDTAAAGLNSMADTMGNLMKSYSAWAKDNPLTATGVAGGVGAAGLAGAGFVATQLWSLVSAGPALNEAAAALNVAAGRLGASAGLPEVPGVGKKAMGRLPRMLLGGVALTGVGYGATKILEYGEENNWGGSWSDGNENAKSMREQERARVESRKARDRELENRYTRKPYVGPGIIPGGAASFGFGNGGFDLSSLSALQNLKAVVTDPIPVKVDPVELKGQGTVAVTVKVDGPGRIAGMATSSSGNIEVEGRALVGTPGSPDKRYGAY